MRAVAALIAMALASLMAACGPESGERSVQLLLDRLQPSLAHAEVLAMSVVDLAEDDELLQRQQATPVRGGSTQKILTALAALTVLGEDHTRATALVEGPDRGQVVLRGDGDPLLSMGDLNQLAEAGVSYAKSAGFTSLDVRTDASLFASDGAAPGWPADGSPVPMMSALQLFDGGREGPPADAAGQALAQALSAHGMPARYTGAADNPRDDAPIIATASGHTVGQMVRTALTNSDSDIAETLFRLVAVASGLPATWAGGAAAVTGVLKRQGLPLERVRIIDGSGVSNLNRLTAQLLTGALDQAAGDANMVDLVKGLPVAGQTGTLGPRSGRYQSGPASCAAGRIAAKTGTMGRSVALAGFAEDQMENRTAFAVLIDDLSPGIPIEAVRGAIDDAAAALAGCQ